MFLTLSRHRAHAYCSLCSFFPRPLHPLLHQPLVGCACTMLLCVHKQVQVGLLPSVVLAVF